MTDTAPEQLFWQVIEILDNKGLLPHVLVIGSWAEYLYHDYFEGEFTPNIRTHDLDFVIRNIRKPANPVSLAPYLRAQGFLHDVDRVSGVNKFFYEGGFEVEFLAPAYGVGERYIKVPSLDIISQSIRNLSILLRNPIVVTSHGYELITPEPAAYILQKVLINQERKGYKQQKDAQSLEWLCQYIAEKPSEVERLQAVFADSLSKKQQRSALHEWERLQLPDLLVVR